MTVLFALNQAELEPIKAAISDQITWVKSSQEAHDYLEQNPREMVLIISNSVPRVVVASLARRYRIERPALGILVMRNTVDATTLREALTAGIRDVVPTNDANALLAAYNHSKELSREIAAHDRSDVEVKVGKIILVFGAKGGCGKTTIATNLALALSDSGKRSVVLLDLDLEFGDVAINLGLQPKVTISTASHMHGNLDRSAVSSIITHHPSGLDVVLAPGKPAEAEAVTPELVVDLIQNLRTMYDYVVIDSAPSFSEITLKCFEIADIYELVTSLDLPSLKNLNLAVNTLDALGFPRSKWRLILNRANAKVGLTPKDVEELLGLKISTAIPSSGAVAAALNSGKTMWETQKDHPVTDAIANCAQVLVGEIQGERTSPKKRLLWKRSKAAKWA